MKNIHIRKVDDDSYRIMKVIAAKAGMSLNGYLLLVIRKLALTEGKRK